MQQGGSILKDLIDQQLLKQQREQLHQRIQDLAQSSLFINPDTHLGQQQLRITNPATHQGYLQQQQSVLDEDQENEDGSEDIAEALLSLQGGGDNQQVSKRVKMETNEVYAGTGSSWPTLKRIATQDKPHSPQIHSPSQSDQTPNQKSRNNSLRPNLKFSDRSVKEAGGSADEGSDNQATASGSSKDSAEDMRFDGMCEHQTEDQQDMAALEDMDQEDMEALEDMEISVVSDTEKGCQVWLPPLPGDYERRKQEKQGALPDNGRKVMFKRKLNEQEVPQIGLPVHGSALGGASQGNSAAVATTGSGPRSSRCIWTPELHDRFVESVKKLGVRTAVPKAILQMMGVSGMTRENVASHLQKYRLSLRRRGELTNDVPSFGPASVTVPSVGMVGDIGKLHFVADHQKLGLDMDSASGGYACSDIPLVHTVGESGKQDLGPDLSLNDNRLVQLLIKPPVQMQYIQPVIQGQGQMMSISQSPMLQYLLKGGQGGLPHGSMGNMVPGGQLLYPVILQGGGVAASPNPWQSHAVEPDQTCIRENGGRDQPCSP